jgi:hypothetical protein
MFACTHPGRRVGEVIRTPDPAPGPTDLVVSPDGTSMAAAVFHPVAYLWGLETGRIVRRIHGAVYRLISGAFVTAVRRCGPPPADPSTAATCSIRSRRSSSPEGWPAGD